MEKTAKTALNRKQIKSIRNVLVQPFKNKWPLLPETEAANFNMLFKQIPQNLLVNGINESVQLINEGEACLLLLNSGFHPQILGKQIIRMALRIIPDIKILVVEKLAVQGSPQKIIAIRKNSRDQVEPSYQLLKLITEIYKSNNYENVDNRASVNDEKQKLKKMNADEQITPEVITKQYLTRRDTKKREFVPPVSVFASRNTDLTEKDEWDEYVSFTQQKYVQSDKIKIQKKNPFHHTAKTKKSRRNEVTYVPLSVNRIQGNPERKRKKK
ncbi:uncharacterized protein LOC129732647 isoform X1 [Wyeomyia smithii]|uniref:uncharacterized protein LOC129732647 isoform X1 n=1 Tax=Wyeomyia smithii TaxID=174621 RepID=UPI002467B6C3|nr:uncharacterized protein LOC129732647 isoform X1 [Wyeomyia smithii]